MIWRNGAPHMVRTPCAQVQPHTHFHPLTGKRMFGYRLSLRLPNCVTACPRLRRGRRLWKWIATACAKSWLRLICARLLSMVIFALLRLGPMPPSGRAIKRKLSAIGGGNRLKRWRRLGAGGSGRGGNARLPPSYLSTWLARGVFGAGGLCVVTAVRRVLCVARHNRPGRSACGRPRRWSVSTLQARPQAGRPQAGECSAVPSRLAVPGLCRGAIGSLACLL